MGKANEARRENSRANGYDLGPFRIKRNILHRRTIRRLIVFNNSGGGGEVEGFGTVSRNKTRRNKAEVFEKDKFQRRIVVKDIRAIVLIFLFFSFLFSFVSTGNNPNPYTERK